MLSIRRNDRAGALAEYKVLLALAAGLFDVIYPPPGPAVPAEPASSEVNFD